MFDVQLLITSKPDKMVQTIDGDIMARRGRPPKTETTVAAEPKKTTTARKSAEKKPIRLSEIHEGDLAKLKKELTTEITKEVMRSVVNPLVKEFQKIDK